MSEAGIPARPTELAGWRKLAVDFGPLLVFFVANARADLFVATGAFMAAVAVAVAVSWLATRRVPPMLWVSAVLVAVFGGLTLWLQDETFIKVKPTLVFLIFASVLGFGLLVERNYLKTLMGAALPGVGDRGWTLLQQRWTGFFLVLALLNELFWRFTPTDVWVHFKVWGDTLLTFLFALAQFPLMKRHGLQLKD